MKALFPNILLVLALAGTSVVAAAGNGPLSLTVAPDRVALTANDMTLRNYPGKLQFSLSGPYGNYGSDARDASNMTLATIEVQADTDNEKRVVLTSKTLHWPDSDYVFRLTLSAKAGCPGVMIETALKNSGKYPGKTYYFFKLVPIHSEYYDDADGEQNATKEDIPLTRWLYLPTNNSPGGYGVIFPEIGTFTLTTLYPRADWRTAGWYFSPKTDRYNPRYLKSGEENSIRFLIFPAKNAAAVAAAFAAFPQ